MLQVFTKTAEGIVFDKILGKFVYVKPSVFSIVKGVGYVL
jgi:hypothetical protein